MARVGEIFAHTYKIVEGQDKPETQLAAANYPLSGYYVDVSGCERFHVVIHLGAIHGSDAPSFKIKQADAVDGTLDTIDATYAEHTCAADDDGEWVLFTIEVDKLATDHHFVSCVVAGVTNGSYADIFYLLPLLSLPVTQATAVCPSASQHNFVG